MSGPSVALPEYRLLEADPAACRLELRIASSLPYFEGHFSSTPVLAGIVQLGWVIELAHRHLGTPRAVGHIGPLKFHRTITPETSVVAELRLQQREQLLFRITSQSNVHASGTLHFEAAP